MSSKDDHEWVITDNVFHRRVSHVRNTMHGNPEAARLAMELVQAKRAAQAQQAQETIQPGQALQQVQGVELQGAAPVNNGYDQGLEAPSLDGYAAGYAGAPGKICICGDVSEEELEARALFDPQLPIFKFRYILSRLRSELARAGRYNHVTSVMIIAIDGFNQLSASYGNSTHIVQEDILRAASQRFAAIVRRDIDLLGRYLNERFIVVMPETTPENASVLASRIRGAIEGVVLEQLYHKIRFTVSIGISSCAGDLMPAEELIMQADMAAEAVEKKGGNGVYVV